MATQQQQIPAKSELARRFLSGVVLILVLVGFCIWGVTPFAILMVVLALCGRFELTRAYAGRGIRPNGLLSLVGALMPGAVLLMPWWTAWASRDPILAGPLLLACLLIAAGLWETAVASAAPDVRAIHVGRNLSSGLLCGAYVALFSVLVLLRLSSWQGTRHALLPVDGGTGLVLLTFFCTMVCDAVAYLAGRAAGRHKLAPVLSPKKTTEGLVSGIAASVILGGVVGFLLLGSTVFGLLIGFVAGLLGPMGDLFKSALKRELGIKDFGDLIPGHGGVLDRFDSILITAPFVLLLVKTIGPWISRLG